MARLPGVFRKRSFALSGSPSVLQARWGFSLSRHTGRRASMASTCQARFSLSSSTDKGSPATPGSMRAVVLDSPGGVEALKYTRRPVPKLEDYSGDARFAARVRVMSCAVAYRDIIDRTGGFPFMQQPTVLGHEFAGVVESVGDSVDPGILAPGDRVVSLHWAQDLGWPAPFDSKAAMDTFLGLGCDGGYAEYCVTHHSAFVKVRAL